MSDPPPPHPPEPSFAPDALTSFHVRKARAGDDESLAWVVQRFTPLLIAQADYHLGSKLRSVCDPEDLVNDTWMVALPRLSELPHRDGRFTPVMLKFLTTTLVYHVRNLVKKELRRGPRSAPGAGEGDALDALPLERTGVVTEATRREARGRVVACIQELDAEDREIVVLRGIEQQPNHVVALLLEMNPRTVASRYHRALVKLRERLPGSVFDELPLD